MTQISAKKKKKSLCKKDAMTLFFTIIIVLFSASFCCFFQDLGAGEKGRVHFRFQRHPEFLRVGSRVLFREGRTKGIGEIVRLIHSCEGATSVHEEINHSQKPERRKHYTSK